MSPQSRFRDCSLDTDRTAGSPVTRRPWVISMAAIWLTVAAMCAPFLAVPVGAAPETDFTGIDGYPYAAGWAAAADGPQPYPDIFPDLAIPLTMSDGTVIKADVFRPGRGGHLTDEKLPTVVEFETYNKTVLNLYGAILKIPGVNEVLLPVLGSIAAPPGSGLEAVTDLTSQLDSGALQVFSPNFDLVNGGYNLVHVDIRGTGTSEGQWQLFGGKERRDTTEIIDWITHQPWSDGTVGLKGTSATAIAALRAADHAGAEVKAVWSYLGSGDLLNDLVIPGGSVGFGFAAFWPLGVNILKFAPDVEAILAGRFDPAQQLRWLQDRLADPLTFVDVSANAFTALNLDQLTPRTRELFDPNSELRKGLTADLRNMHAPAFLIDAWWDIFGKTPTESYDALPLPPEQKKTIIGEGYHLGGGVGGFGRPGMPPRLDVLQRAWFDRWLKGVDNGIDRYSPVTLMRQSGSWEGSLSTPRPESGYRRMYLTDQRSGTSDALYDGGLAPAQAQTSVHDLVVAPGVLSVCSRETARILAGGGPGVVMACSEDSRIWEKNGLTFTSSPVAVPTTLSGPINAHLNVVHEATDGYWVVTVNDVFPNGRSRQIGSGQLVASLRQIDEAASTKSENGDYIQPSYPVDLARRETVPPGQPLVLDIAIPDIQAVLLPGHRLRIDVFASNFPNGLPILPILIDSRLAPQHVRLDPAEPSWVNLPLDGAIPE